MVVLVISLIIGVWTKQKLKFGKYEKMCWRAKMIIKSFSFPCQDYLNPVYGQWLRFKRLVYSINKTVRMMGTWDIVLYGLINSGYQQYFPLTLIRVWFVLFLCFWTWPGLGYLERYSFSDMHWIEFIICFNTKPILENIASYGIDEVTWI